MSDIIGAFVTASSPEEARAIGRGVLEKRVAACVNILPGAESHYWWEGNLETAQECVLLFKTRREHLEALVAAVKALHSYTVPEVIAFPIEGGNADYLKWVEAEARP
ncbi:MAG: divalent-cation tolerance protein CutA [Armatimonadetes bacterium]|nr:divalent-cation tolerance protein CutA [Armatimonadota bacterium]